MTRIASLVLIAPTGELMGQLPAIELACPHLPESRDLVSAQAGSVLTFIYKGTTGGIDVFLRTPGSALIAKLTIAAGTGYRWVDLIYTTQWELLRYQVA